jgi:mandelamide amidase
MAPAGLGSDTGGSVRIPAALTGISGLRPTLGRYSQEGITPIAHTRDTAGPMAREVADLVLLDTVITGARDKVAPAALGGLRVGVPRAAFWRNLDAETERLASAALEQLRGAGVEVLEVARSRDPSRRRGSPMRGRRSREPRRARWPCQRDHEARGARAKEFAR